MVIKGHYLGLPLADLEKARTQLFEALESARKGNRFSEVDMGGKMGKKALLSYNEIVHELKEVEYALKKAFPDIYGKPIKRLIPNFNPALARLVCRPNDGKTHYMPEEMFVDTGATAYDPVEGTLVAERLDEPNMTIVGNQDIRYQAYNSKGQIVVGIRKITIVDTVTVTGLQDIFGGIVNDDTYYYKRGISSINFTEGYWEDKDYQTQIVKENNRWAIKDYSGMTHDIQKNEAMTPLSSSSNWSTIIVENDVI